MSIANKIRNEHNFLIEKIQNSKSNYKKRELIELLIGNLLASGIVFSIRQIAKILSVTRPLVKKVWKNFQIPITQLKKKKRKQEEEKKFKKNVLILFLK